MNASNAKDYLPLVQALAEGKTIQGLMWSSGKWEDMAGEICFDGPASDYRIKPEPREIWVNHYANPCRLDQICDSKEEADQRSASGELVCQIRYREVIE